MTKDYSYNDHTHCWEQEQPSACGIPLSKHSRCCLCKEEYPTDAYAEQLDTERDMQAPDWSRIR